MLACRPMLCFAIAAMAGAVSFRLHPQLVDFLLHGWTLFAILVLWFLVSPGRPQPTPATIPENYVRHIMPRPQFLALRGLNRFIIIASLGLFLIGGMRQASWNERLADDALFLNTWFDATLLALAPSREHAGEDGQWRVPALLLTADGKAAGNMPVRLSGRGKGTFRRGDVLAARVRKNTLFPPSYPGAFNVRLWLERDGSAASLTVVRSRNTPREADPYLVTPLDNPGPVVSVRRGIDSLRAKAIAATLERGGSEGPVLAAMLYGYRKDIEDHLRDAFRRVGIGHVLAISGLHVGLVIGLLWWMSGWFGWGLRWRAIACLILSLFYLGMSGGQVAASRATLMAVIHLAGIACGRRGDMLNSLGAAALILTLLNPSAPLDVSFQLSFTAVVFIYLAMHRIRNAGNGFTNDKRSALSPPWRRRLASEVSSLVRLSISTWVGLFPIIAVVFNQVNLVGLPINIVVIPMMSLVLAGGLLLPWFGWIPGFSWLLTLPSVLLSKLALAADLIPLSSFPAHAPSAFWVFLFYGCALFFLLRGMIRGPKLQWAWEIAAACGIAASLIGMTASMRSLPPPATGRIAVLPGRDVGTIIAESPEGGTAVLGVVARGGLNVAGWLHHLKRGGDLGVVRIGGKGADDLAPLGYHYVIDSYSGIAATDKNSISEDAAWKGVSGAPGIDFALSRDSRGRVVWLAVRAGEQSVCVAPRLAAHQLTWRLERDMPGSAAVLFCLGFVEKDVRLPIIPSPAGVVLLQGKYEGDLPSGWFERNAFGVVLVNDMVLGYDGCEWQTLK